MIRDAEPADGQNMADWILSTPHNSFDPAIATYPHLHTFAIEDEDGPLLYVPIHPVLVVESVAARPNITAKKYIMALTEAKSAIEDMARQSGIREIYTNSGYGPMIKALRRHGYEPVTGALRKRVSK